MNTGREITQQDYQYDHTPEERLLYIKEEKTFMERGSA